MASKVNSNILQNFQMKSLGTGCPSNYNPADYFVQMLAIVPGQEVTCRQSINSICDSFQKSDLGTKIALEAETTHGEYEDLMEWKIGSSKISSPYKATWCEQFRAVLWRSWLSVIKEPILIKVRLLQTVVSLSSAREKFQISSNSNFSVSIFYLQFFLIYV